MVEIIAAACAGFLAGWLMGRLDRDTQDDWRRRFNHENRRGPVGPPPLRLDPGRTIRGNGSGGPTTPKPKILPRGTNPSAPGAKPPPPAERLPEKPEPPLGRVVDASGRTIGTIRAPQLLHGLITDAHGHVVGYIPLPDPQGGTPNPPPSEP